MKYGLAVKTPPPPPWGASALTTLPTDSGSYILRVGVAYIYLAGQHDMKEVHVQLHVWFVPYRGGCFILVI